MAQQRETHYHKDVEGCYQDHGSLGQVGDNRKALASCLAESKREYEKGLYSGFSFEWNEGEFWSYKGYWLGMGWWLVMLIAFPPLLFYSCAWAVALVRRWIWRGFRTGPDRIASDRFN